MLGESELIHGTKNFAIEPQDEKRPMQYETNDDNTPENIARCERCKFVDCIYVSCERCILINGFNFETADFNNKHRKHKPHKTKK